MTNQPEEAMIVSKKCALDVGILLRTSENADGSKSLGITIRIHHLGTRNIDTNMVD